jgi:hypothetical protein
MKKSHISKQERKQIKQLRDLRKNPRGKSWNSVPLGS